MDVRDHGFLTRSRAIGMLEGGKTQKEVAQHLVVSICSVKRWWSSHKQGNSLMTKPRSGRPRILGRVDKIVFAKSLGKCRQSTRKLAQKLKNMDSPVSHMCVYRHLTQSMGVRSFKRQKLPRAKITSGICQKARELDCHRLEKCFMVRRVTFPAFCTAKQTE